jgi:Helix-turn-helix domain
MYSQVGITHFRQRVCIAQGVLRGRLRVRSAEGTPLFQPVGNLLPAAAPAAVPCVYIGHAPSTPLTHAQKKALEREAHAYNARNRQPGQHQGPLTAATLRCLHVLLWTFHNTEHGYCWPSLRKIAAAARCCKDTAHEAVKALRAAGFLRWWHQFKRKTIAGVRGLYRTASAYVFQRVMPSVSGEQQRTEKPDARTGAAKQEQGASQLMGPASSVIPPSELEGAIGRLMALKPGG